MNALNLGMPRLTQTNTPACRTYCTGRMGLGRIPSSVHADEADGLFACLWLRPVHQQSQRQSMQYVRTACSEAICVHMLQSLM